MTTFDYQTSAERLVLLCQLLDDVDLDEMLTTISTADTIGPIVDPTAYRDMLYRKGGNMHDVERLARLAKPLQEQYRETMAKVTA